jgi:hypothetical protein
MHRPTWLIGLVAVLVLSGCAKAPAPAADPGVAQEEEITLQNVPAAEPAPVAEDAAQQAGLLAGHIDPRPECAQFRQPLEAASKAAPGSPEAKVDMTGIMQQAQAANCTRK